jgi:beta-glucosidase
LKATVDASVIRVLTPMFAMGLFDVVNNNTLSNNVTSDSNNAAARTLSEASHVLLKNDLVGSSARLPLLGLDQSVKGLKIGMFGLAADASPIAGGLGSGGFALFSPFLR